MKNKILEKNQLCWYNFDCRYIYNIVDYKFNYAKFESESDGHYSIRSVIYLYWSVTWAYYSISIVYLTIFNWDLNLNR